MTIITSSFDKSLAGLFPPAPTGDSDGFKLPSDEPEKRQPQLERTQIAPLLVASATGGAGLAVPLREISGGFKGEFDYEVTGAMAKRVQGLVAHLAAELAPAAGEIAEQQGSRIDERSLGTLLTRYMQARRDGSSHDELLDPSNSAKIPGGAGSQAILAGLPREALDKLGAATQAMKAAEDAPNDISAGDALKLLDKFDAVIGSVGGYQEDPALSAPIGFFRERLGEALGQ